MCSSRAVSSWVYNDRRPKRRRAHHALLTTLMAPPPSLAMPQASKQAGPPARHCRGRRSGLRSVRPAHERLPPRPSA